MLVNRAKLIRHLSRLHCSGRIAEVVLDGNFQAVAMTPDQQLFMEVKGLADVEDLPAEVGVLNLSLLLKSLKTFGEDDNEDIAFSVEDFRIRMEEKGRGVLSLVTTSPGHVQTRVEDGTADAVYKITKPALKQGIPLPQSFAETLLRTSALLRPDTVRIQREKGGTKFIVGSEQSDYAELVLPNSKLRKGEKEFELVLDAGLVQAVFQQLDDFTLTQIAFTGEDSLVVLWDDEFTFILSPMEEA